LCQILEGSSGKCIALSSGVCEAQVSKTLAAAALRLGLRDRSELLRFAATQENLRQTPVPHALTPAERGVLELVVEGRSNAEIACLRGRSQTTVSKQVSALLRKTGLSSRRSLIIAFCNGDRRDVSSSTARVHLQSDWRLASGSRP
jgi:DNA-binding NarL/FixJ family response regulator